MRYARVGNSGANRNTLNAATTLSTNGCRTQKSNGYQREPDYQSNARYNLSCEQVFHCLHP
jgi:hypothetical protein